MSDIAKLKVKLKDSTREVLDDKADIDGLYVFFSYDLVNSTKFKTISKKNWALVIHQFYTFVEAGLTNRQIDAHIWRSVGDELLLYKKINAQSDVKEILSTAYEVLQDTIHRLHNLVPDNRTLISVKSTVWAADVKYVPSHDLSNLKNEYRNIVVYHSSHANDKRLDFLGPDIDVGFRIAKHSVRSRLLVGCKLAYWLYLHSCSTRTHESFDNCLKIVSYEKLKGIWNDRCYPILWYERDWTKIKNTFYYDEQFDHEVINKVVNDTIPLEPASKIEKILKDLDKQTGLEEIWKLLPQEETIKEAPDLVLPTVGIEIHCVAICFNSKNEILVGKRKKTKSRLPEHWEFGCGQLMIFDDFESCLKRSYKEDFNIELKFDSPIKPISTFYLNDDGDSKKIPGIIFVATILDDSSAECKRHEAIRWISREDLDGICDEEKYVPKFKDNVLLAYEAIEKNNVN